jgi:hypothetical protein
MVASDQVRSIHPIPNTAALILNRFYWFRLTVASLIWFIYDFLTYSFGIYSFGIYSSA